MCNLNKVKHSGIHDDELISIAVDYNKALLEIQLRTPVGEDYKICIKKFCIFEISHQEPWGKGTYVCSSEISYDESTDRYLLEMELNSGDKIMVKYICD